MRYLLLALVMVFSLANTTGDRIDTLRGEGRAQEAFALAQEAAEAGDAEGHAWLGWFYENGEVVEVDLEKAVYHLRIAAAGGDDYARWRIGVLIDQGTAQGTLEEAVALFEAAAGEGYTDAMVSLAVMKATGRGTVQDYPAALDWYMRAARAGNAHGVQGVGVLFALGQGVETNEEEAAAWFLAATYAGSSVGEANFARMTRDMSPLQMDFIVERANAIARELGIPAEGVFDPEEPALPAG
jgi:TPR repeat protein